MLLVGTIASQAEAVVRNVPGDFPTIQGALNASANGDTVLVAPGNYPENLNFNGRSIELRSTNGPAVTSIHPNGGTAVTIGGLRITAERDA